MLTWHLPPSRCCNCNKVATYKKWFLIDQILESIRFSARLRSWEVIVFINICGVRRENPQVVGRCQIFETCRLLVSCALAYREKKMRINSIKEKRSPATTSHVSPFSNPLGIVMAALQYWGSQLFSPHLKSSPSNHLPNTVGTHSSNLWSSWCFLLLKISPQGSLSCDFRKSS